MRQTEQRSIHRRRAFQDNQNLQS